MYIKFDLFTCKLYTIGVNSAHSTPLHMCSTHLQKWFSLSFSCEIFRLFILFGSIDASFNKHYTLNILRRSMYEKRTIENKTDYHSLPIISSVRLCI